MAKTIVPNSNTQLVKHDRTKLHKMDLDELKSYQLASFQITNGEVKTYIQFNVKERKQGLKCYREEFYYIKVPNTNPKARKPYIFVYMDAKTRGIYGKKESSREITMEEAKREINRLRSKVSPTRRTGTRAY